MVMCMIIANSKLLGLLTSSIQKKKNLISVNVSYCFQMLLQDHKKFWRKNRHE